jgi:hypothetical protein
MKKKNDTHSRIPLAELIQEGCDTQYICEKDKAELVSSDFDWELVDSLPLLTERCIRADTKWQVCKGDKKVITGELQDMAKVAKKLRSKFAGIIRASRTFVESGRSLPSMSRNNKYEDIIQDLYELYYIAGRICEKNIKAISDTKCMEQVLTMHSRLNAKFVKKACYKNILIERAQERDLAAKELKNTLVAIHVAAKNALEKDPVKASRYCLRYYKIHRMKNKLKRKKKN